MYPGATTAVKMMNDVRREFAVKVGEHQGPLLSPLLFIIMIEASK